MLSYVVGAITLHGESHPDFGQWRKQNSDKGNFSDFNYSTSALMDLLVIQSATHWRDFVNIIIS